MSPNAAGGLTHEEWQQQVVDAAHIFGWRHLHVRRTIGRGKRWTTSTNVKGWPDLFLWHEAKQATAAIELKVGTDKPTPEQIDVLASLKRAGVRCLVAYPDDWPLVEQLLRGGL